MLATDKHLIGLALVAPRVVRRERVASACAVGLPYVGLSTGAWLLVLSYRAADGARALHAFDLFWLGILLFLVPTTCRLLGVSASRLERLALIASAGAFLFIPKVLRDPSGPLYYDELAHWRQSETISRMQALFQPNPIVHVSEFFPGLDSVNVALQRMTGLSTFAAGLAMIATAHVLALVGVFRLGERVLGSARLGALAALVYALNTSFIFFDSQYSYESLAIAFFIWAVACTAEALAAPPGASRLGWVSAALACALACVVTHHLSSYALIGALLCITLGSVVVATRGRSRRQTVLTSACLLVSVVAAAAVWIVVVAPDVVGYFAPDIKRGVTQITHLAQRSGGTQRQLFAKSLVPGYERSAAFFAPVLSLVFGCLGFWRLRRRLLQVNGVLLGLTAFGSIYFVSLPFILTQGAAESARRSWAFTTLGLCLLIAAGLAAVADRARRRSPRAGIAATVALTGIIVVIAVGNTASGVNAEYRFPGAFSYGSDARTVTAETNAAVQWLQLNGGLQQRTIVDRDTGLAFGTLGGQWIERAWSGFPVWQFYFRAAQPDRSLLKVVQQAGVRYLIVDARMARSLPRTGVYFVPDEPDARRHTAPVPQAALDKFAIAPWAIEIYSTDNYRIYRLDLALIDTCSDDARAALGGPTCTSAR